jgi:hypothetical protein
VELVVLGREREVAFEVHGAVDRVGQAGRIQLGDRDRHARVLARDADGRRPADGEARPAHSGQTTRVLLKRTSTKKERRRGSR